MSLALSALAGNHGGVEEAWSEASQAAMGPQGTAKRDDGGAEVVGRAPARTEGDASPTSDGRAHSPPARVTGQDFTFLFTAMVYLFFTISLPRFSPASRGPGHGTRHRGFRRRGW